jgi:hypothetical protein
LVILSGGFLKNPREKWSKKSNKITFFKGCWSSAGTGILCHDFIGSMS